MLHGVFLQTIAEEDKDEEKEEKWEEEKEEDRALQKGGVMGTPKEDDLDEGEEHSSSSTNLSGIFSDDGERQ